jgi:propanol-preferring alcohol dehydrogenase
MRAMLWDKLGEPLYLKDVPIPKPLPHEVLIKVRACGVCRTDLHIIEGELDFPKKPLILGHQVVGIVEALGSDVKGISRGIRVGVPWLAGTCQHCEFCLSQRENLCDNALFTGYQTNGGYAEYCVANKDYILPIPDIYSDEEAAPLLCAGLIGFRALHLAEPFQKIGLYGFGSSAHILIQLIKSLKKEAYVFTRPGDKTNQDFATSLGAFWVGGSDELPAELLDSALLFAPLGDLYPQALKAIKKGGKVISAGIHMSDIPSFPYKLLWEERSLSSVANLTRNDGKDFMKLVEKIPVKVSVHVFPLEEANEALKALKEGKYKGSIVLKI